MNIIQSYFYNNKHSISIDKKQAKLLYRMNSPNKIQNPSTLKLCYFSNDLLSSKQKNQSISVKTKKSQLSRKLILKLPNLRQTVLKTDNLDHLNKGINSYNSSSMLQKQNSNFLINEVRQELKNFNHQSSEKIISDLINFSKEKHKQPEKEMNFNANYDKITMKTPNMRKKDIITSMNPKISYTHLVHDPDILHNYYHENFNTMKKIKQLGFSNLLKTKREYNYIN